MDIDGDQPGDRNSEVTSNTEPSNSNGIEANQNCSVSTAAKMSSNSNQTNLKQQAIKRKIEQYFHRLTQGCKRENCTNPNCASNPSWKKLSENDAALKAIKLVREKAEICLLQSEEINSSQSSSSSISAGHNKSENGSTGNVSLSDNMPSAMDTNNKTPSSDVETKPLLSESNMEIIRVEDFKYLTEEMLDDIIKQCKEEEELKNAETGNTDKQDSKDPYLPLFRSITEVFSNMEGLNRSFLLKPDAVSISDDKVLPGDKSEAKKESKDKMEVDSQPVNEKSEPNQSMDITEAVQAEGHMPFMNFLRSLSSEEGDIELLQASNSSAPGGLRRAGGVKKKPLGARPKRNHGHIVVKQPTVDLESIRRVYGKFRGIEKANMALVSSLEFLSLDIEVQLNIMRQLKSSTVNLNVFVIIMENPSLHSPEYLEMSLPSFCGAMAALPIQGQADLARWWSTYDAERLKTMVQCFQQLITFKVLTRKLFNSDSEHLDLHSSDVVTSAVKCLKILYYASLLGGEIDREHDERGSVNNKSSSTLGALSSAMGLDNDDDLDGFDKTQWKEPLSDLLGISGIDSVKPLVPFSEFQNEILNETFDVYNDFTNYLTGKTKSEKFTFMHYPFVVNTVNKTTYLFYDNKIQMLSGRRMMLLSSILHGSAVSPYLRLKIRRDHVIDDALVRLELIAEENPRDLRKQLYVEFEGEQGVDEGGVSKEFFQLVVNQIFNPDYGMFTYNEDTHLFWFSAHSFENKAQFTLIGIVLGLAIYNNCILDIKFPPVVYKKLLGKKGRFEDMKESHPSLYQGLKGLLEYEGNVEEDMMTTFSIGYHDMFGTSRSFELKPDGINIPVTKDNRKEYVELYTNWLLNESIAEQFGAFRHGFELVVAKSPLKNMFRTQELEILVSGSQIYDFNSLESTSDYDGGFTKDSQSVKDFWSVVHEMSEEDKKKLLQFTTGTDRAPVGGLSQLKLVIARNGPDSDRLPTAHTCFNVILLPDYKNRDKLKERLHKAITYAKGFGML
ncbi:ubiquitin-protein ligase E3A-like isoform X1 [Styela clava]